MHRQFEAELRVLEGKGYILPREATALALKYKAYGVDKTMVRAMAGCPIAESPAPAPAQAAPDVLDWSAAKEIRRGLDVLDLPDLYAFLGQPSYSPVRKLQEAAQRKGRPGGGNASPRVAVQRELAAICVSLFASPESKQRYDHYITLSQYPALGDLIDQEYTRGRFISPAVLVRLVNFAVEKYGVGVLEAEKYIRKYCAAYSIPLDAEGRDIHCPGCGEAADRKASACSHCSAPLKGECPGCGAQFSGGAAVCGECGFALGDMVKALGFLDDAESAIIESNFGTARRGMQYADKYWPGHPRLTELEKRVQNLEDRYARYVRSVGDCIQNNQYYAALELLDEAAELRVRMPVSLTAPVQKVVRDFEQRIASLQAGARPPGYKEMVELSRMVADSLELNRMMADYPPRSPSVLRARVQGRQVLVQWNVSDSPGKLDYVLVRKEAMEPMTAFDGDLLFQGGGHSFVDESAQPLVEYYYQVYARRGTAYAPQGTSFGPVLIVPEVENLHIFPADMSAQLSWDFSPHIREVSIWRKLGGGRPSGPGQGIKLENSRLDGYTDMKLKNDVEYWYYVVAGYVVDGKQVVSQGTCESVVPHKIIAPVEDLAISRADGGEDEYVVNWSGSQHDDVILLASVKRPPFRSGEMLPVDKLLAEYRRLDLEAKMPDSARFRFAFSGGIHIFAAAISGKFATVGSSRYLSNVQDMEQPVYQLEKEALTLRFGWPQGVGEVAVVYRFDHYPNHPDEVGVTALRYTREQYDLSNGVIIREPEEGRYYIKIFSQFTEPDGAKTYARGVELLVNNSALMEVFYNFRYQKRLFKATNMVTVTLAAPQRIKLPRAVFVGKIGRMPLNPAEGMPLFEIEKEVEIDGSVAIQYSTDHLPRNLYIRMFLHDDSGYSRYRLLPLYDIKVT